MAAETYRITEEMVVEDKTGAGLSSAGKKVSQFDKTIQETQSRLTKLTGSKWSMSLEAVDKSTKVISTVESKINSAVGKAWNFTVGIIDKVTSPLQSIFNLLKNPLLQAGAMLGITVSVSDAISTFSGFESTMSQVKAISGASGEDFENLTALAKEMGATTKFTAEEAAQGLTYMAMAGWKTEDMMTSLSGVMSLAAASGEDLATVSDIVTDAMTAFGLAADGYTANGVANATHFSDVLAAASSNSNTTVSGMGETFKYVGTMAGALGYSIEDVALATGLMANSGVKGTMAGTALNAMLTRLSTNTSGATDAISALGVEFYNADGSARNLGDVMGELRTATMNMSAAEKSELANTVAGTEAQKGLLAILNASEDDYNSLADAIYNADGAAQTMSDTMLDNLEGSLTLLQSAVDGVKLSLGSRLSPYIRQFADWLTTKMPAVEQAISDVMDTVDEKIQWLKGTIDEFTSSDEWADADIWGKISIAWDKIIAEPFSQWWEGTGKPWLTEKIAGFGETLGSGITTGLLAILGFDASGAIEDGKSIGASFVEGFKDGFDTEQISEALSDWASDHKGIIAAAGVVVGGKLLGGISRAFQSGKNTLSSIKSLFGDSSTSTAGSALGTYTTSTMTVTAGTVIINSGAGQAANAVKNVVTSAAGGSGTLALPSAGSTLALPGATTAAAATGWTSATGTIGKILQAGSTSSVIGADGTLLAVQGGVGGALTSLGGALGSTATTAAGTAAAGLAASGGIIGTLLGLGSAGIDIYQGVQKSKEGDSKGAKDEYVTAGTKAGMVGAGAGVGAAIGSVVPGIGTAIGALVGAGIGGIGALIGGNKAGKAISDSTDEGGWLNNTGKAIGNFFTKTVPEKTGAFFSGVGDFFTTTLPQWWGGVTDTVSIFFTETIPEKWSEFWDSVGSFFTETVPYALGYALGKIQVFFTETVPEFFGSLWDSISTFFTSTLPQWASDVWNSHIVPFFTESIPNFFGNLWTNITTFFTETLPTWASDTWNNKIVPFFTESVPEFFGNLWNNIVTFFTETLPTWASSIWNDNIVPFFTETIPGFFGDVWDSVTGFFTETLPTIAGGIWDSICGFFTETVPSFFEDVWGRITSFFSAGYSDATSGTGSHAEGGIMNAPHLAQVAEDGPEAIIPLGASSRPRGMAVWKEAGDILGAYGDNAEAGGYTSTAPASTTAAEGPQEPSISIPINITLNPEFIIQGTEGMSADNILAVIKERIRELVDDISDEMAEKLARIFANMPVKGGA